MRRSLSQSISWTANRLAGHGDGCRHAFHQSHTSLGAAGHFIHLAAVGAPLIIGDLVTDSDKRWRYTRLAAFGAALASEAIWTFKVAHDRKRENDPASIPRTPDSCRFQAALEVRG